MARIIWHVQHYVFVQQFSLYVLLYSFFYIKLNEVWGVVYNLGYQNGMVYYDLEILQSASI